MNFKFLFLILLGVFVLISIYNTISFNSLTKILNRSSEFNKPANVDILVINAKNCEYCFDVNKIAESLKNVSNLKIRSFKVLEYPSEDAKKIINEFSIKKLPTIVIRGETEKIDVSNFERRNNSLILSSIAPPYYDLSKDKTVGLVEIILFKKTDCSQCRNFDGLANYINSSTKTIKFEVLDEKSDLIKNFNIEKLPTLLISEDVLLYSIPDIDLSNLPRKGNYVFIESFPPYYDLNSKSVRGLVSVIYLNDSSCNDCYNVKVFRQILVQQLGLYINNETDMDVNFGEGKEVAKKYNITKVPTIILNGDLRAYPNFDNFWMQIGSIGSDGSYVFRNLELLRGAKYKEIKP